MHRPTRQWRVCAAWAGRLAAGFGFVAGLSAGLAFADGAAPAANSSDEAAQQATPPAAAASEAGTPSPLLSGMWPAFGAERRKLDATGFKLGLQEQSELWGNLTGGGRRGASYDGLTTASLDIDLDRAFAWTGGHFFVDVFDIHGHGPTRSLVTNQQIVSNIEATPSVKLYDMWLDQSLLNNSLSIRLGQEGANDEMMIPQYAALFLNSSFGFPGMPAAVLPSGGPNYPMATPFARANFQPNAQVNLIAAVYNGDPAPPGSGDPQIRDRNGTAFRLDDHALAFAELWYSPDASTGAALPTTYKLGAWYASSHFADQRFDTAGGLLAAPESTGLARQHTGDWAFYGIVDQMLWRRAGTKDQGIGAFLQVMAGPSDRNLSNLFVEGGVNWRAPFPTRTGDVLGVGVAYLGISPAARRFSRDLVAFGSASSAYAAGETVIELTYLAPLTSWLTMQPDIQLVLNPGAGIPGGFGRAPLADALVAGARATIKF